MALSVSTTLIVLIALLLAAFLLYVGYRIGCREGAVQSDRLWEGKVPDIRKDAVKQSRAVLGGQFTEQLAPFLPDFPFSPTEVRFIGKPVDFLVFKGMDGKRIEEVVFVEVKSGAASLNPQERSLKEVIENKRVRWVEYRAPQNLTRQHTPK